MVHSADRATNRATVLHAPLFPGLDGFVEPPQIWSDRPDERLKPGQLLFLRKDPADRVFFVRSGLVEILSPMDGSEQISVDFRNGGSLIGETAGAANQHHRFSARTAMPTVVRSMATEIYHDRLASNPDQLVAALREAADTVNRIATAAAEMTLSPATRRLATYLLSLAARGSGTEPVRLPVSKALLARHLGITAPALSRCLKRLRGLGVAVQGNTVRIDDPIGLQTYCEAL